MRIRLTDHIRSRIALRGFDVSLPERIVSDVRERFRDTATGGQIAVAKAEKAARLASGRWVAP